MTFFKYFIYLLFSGFLAAIIFSIGLIILIGLINWLYKSAKQRALALTGIVVVIWVYPSYFGGFWAAYSVLLAYKFALQQTVTWDWIYYLIGFMASTVLIELLSFKVIQRISPVSQNLSNVMELMTDGMVRFKVTRDLYQSLMDGSGFVCKDDLIIFTDQKASEISNAAIEAYQKGKLDTPIAFQEIEAILPSGMVRAIGNYIKDPSLGAAFRSAGVGQYEDITNYLLINESLFNKNKELLGTRLFERQRLSYTGNLYYRLFAITAYIIFAIWPQGIIYLYGWILQPLINWLQFPLNSLASL